MSPRNTRSLRSANLAAELVSWLQRSTDEMAALAAELVAIPTENPPGMEYGACADFLERRLQELGLPCERIQVSHTSAKDRSASPAILLATHGRGSRTLYFHGHYDVVPAQSPQQFQPARRENFLFGRGSSDMKGGVVAMLYAILALKEWGADLNGKICLTLVPDEETGGARGSGWLAQQGLLAPHKQDSSSPRAAAAGMLTAEPTSGVIWNASRGAITLRVEVFGKSAHVGLQHHGENAFERMHRVVARLQNLKHEVEQRKTACTIGADQARDSILMLGGKSGGGMSFRKSAGSRWTGASIRKKTWRRKKHASSACCRNANAMAFRWNGRFCRKAAPRLARKTSPWAAPWRAALKLLPAKRRDLRCVLGSSKPVFMPRRGFLPTPTARGFFPSRTGQTNTSTLGVWPPALPSTLWPR